MSFTGDADSFEQTVIDQTKMIIRLLKAQLLGIELITNESEGSLLESIEEE